MASSLKSKALVNLNKGNTSAYYSYLEEKNGKNPVFIQFDKEISDYMGFVIKKKEGALKANEHAPCKVSDALFDIWNKFEPRVSKRYFYEKLMQVGEFLVQNKEYTTAAWQCYDRFLNQFINDINFSMIKNVQELKEKFFPDGVSNQENSDVTFRAMMGHCICLYHFTITTDPKLQNVNSIQRLTEVLRFMRLIMQVLLEFEYYCWLIYNATIYMYTICRYMMQYGLGKQALEYLIWSALAMENSIPLLGVKYLSWRATLYAATSQCFYDCKYSEDGEKNDLGESFARRALSKINELHELELASINGDKVSQLPQFRDATTKVAVMLFKRIVFESRRKGKGVLRPKTRTNYKDLPTLLWPRTATEKLLHDMFDSTAAQFLAVEEALNDSNRRIAMPMPAAGIYEVEILDGALELFFAAEYLINGGGGRRQELPEKMSELKAVVDSNKTLIQMATDGDSTIPIKNVIKVIQLAFSYEIWDIYRRLSNKLLSMLHKNSDLTVKFNTEIQILNILDTLDKYLSYQRKVKQIKQDQLKATLSQRQSPSKALAKSISKSSIKKAADPVAKTNAPTDSAIFGLSEENLVAASGGRPKLDKHSTKSDIKENTKSEKDDTEDIGVDSASSKSFNEASKEEDYLANIAHKLLHVINLNTKIETLDMDIMIDTTLLLWKKCKETFQKYQTGSHDNFRWVNKLENLAKWLYVLSVTHDSMCYFNISSIDPAVFAHCSLRLGLIYEAFANIGTKEAINGEYSMNLVRIFDSKSTFNVIESYGDKLITNDVQINLLRAKTILKKSLQSISAARAAISKSDKTCLCNKNYDETDNESTDGMTRLEQLKALKESTFTYKKEEQSDSIWNIIADLHVELIFLYEKISVRLLEHEELNKNSQDLNTNFEKNFDILLKECKKNKISQSLLYLAKALYLQAPGCVMKSTQSDLKELVDKAYKCLLKAQDEDKKLFYKNVKVDPKECVKSKTPPAPVICLSTHNKIVLQPRNFQSESGTPVCWYRIFASQVLGPNSKARISDYSFPGSGEQIPSNNNEQITVSGLTADEKYIFAVAAYDQNGKIIGDSIGESTDPILASNPLSLLMNWAYLCQVSYQINSLAITRIAYEVLWQHFIFKQSQPQKETVIKQLETDYKFTFYQLNYNTVTKTSPVLLRKFLECIFISVDLQVKGSEIYPDSLFEEKPQYQVQIERLKESEKMLVAIELAGWLNDPQIILQAVVQCYGLLTPLIYHYIPYEPILQVLTHCLLVLNEIPIQVFQRKSKSIFDSLQHMIACTTYYLTEILKKSNRKSLANIVNSIGRRLVSIEENSELSTEDGDNEFLITNDSYPETKFKQSSSFLGQLKSLQKAQDRNAKLQNQVQSDDKPVNNRNDELRALELYVAKSNKQAAYANGLSGNEESVVIYGFIAQTVTKYVHKELVKFRKRTNFMELYITFLQKALTEELTQDVSDWCADTYDWIQKRNTTILGNKSVVTKKVGVIAVSGNQQPAASYSDAAEETLAKDNTYKGSISQINSYAAFKRRRIKKYKLLIPLDLDEAEKLKMEERQKEAIDKIYDLFPELYDKWIRKRRLRRLLNEECSFKSQFFAIWGLSQFGLLTNRIHQSQNEFVLSTKLQNTQYLDPQRFLFDFNNCLIVPDENRHNTHLFKAEETDEKQLGIGKPQKSDLSKQTLTDLSKSDFSIKVPKIQMSKTSKIFSSSNFGNRMTDLKDTCDLIADTLSGYEVKEEEKQRLASPSPTKSQSRITNMTSNVHNSSSKFIIENLKGIFNKFEKAIVIAHRGKEWTLLQNTCKTVWNCMNALLVLVPIASDSVSIKLNDFWTISGPCLYTAADDLLDMLFYTEPIEFNGQLPAYQLNKWYTSENVGKADASLKFDVPLDNISSIDLRFLKQFIFRTVQSLYSNEKWEKLASLIFRYNALTSYAYAEQLTPILIFAQHQLRKRILKIDNRGSSTSKRGRYSTSSQNSAQSTTPNILTQPHFERLRSELGRDPKPEDLFFVNFRVKINPENVKPLNLGVKIDPRVHDIYNGGERAKELISVPLDIAQTSQSLKDALQNTLYTSRALIHARRLLSIYLLSQSNQTDFFGTNEYLLNDRYDKMKKSMSVPDMKRTSAKVAFENEASDFSDKPRDLLASTFENEKEICVKHTSINLKTVVDSYTKAIDLLVSHEEKDLAVQAINELGDIYYYQRDFKMTYKWWNDALDLLTSCKDSLIKWRKEFFNIETNQISFSLMLSKFGLWGCLTGGLLTSKIAQYLLAHDIELRTEACLFSAAFYKCIYQESVPHSKHDFDYTKEDSESINTDFLLPGISLNSDTHRFDIRTLVASLNFICLELSNAKQYMSIMPIVNLYEHFARNQTRDLDHTIFARLIKIDALIKLNQFSEAIILLQRVQRAEKLPHFIDEKLRPNLPNKINRYHYVQWNSAKPIYDVNNLKCLETMLSLKLPINVVKLYGSHLVCQFYRVQCKLFIQIASCLPCLPNINDFNSSQLFAFHNTYEAKTERTGHSRASQMHSQIVYNQRRNTGAELTLTVNEVSSLDEYPETIKIFSKNLALTVEFIKGCLLGTAKTLLTKCLNLFEDDFPDAQRYCVSTNWQCEFKYEIYMLMSNIAHQSQLDYMALQYIIDAMKELADKPNESTVDNDIADEIPENTKTNKHTLENKQSRYIKKGVYQLFDLISKSHLNTRLWLYARKQFVQIMFNQLSDLGKAKGIDTNILKDFGELKYYCDKGFEESLNFQDSESKAFFLYFSASLELIQSNDLEKCLNMLNLSLKHLQHSMQLSYESQILYIKLKLLQVDLNNSVKILDSKNTSQSINEIFKTLFIIHEYVLEKLKTMEGEVIEAYTNRTQFYYDTIANDIKNLYSPYLNLLVHIKLRLGSCLMLQAEQAPNTEENTRLWQSALKTLSCAYELNKTITERSISLEMEIKYKYARCLRELLIKRQISIRDVIEAYLDVLNLCYNSTHDLSFMKNCYLELSMAFISLLDPALVMSNSINASTDKMKRITPNAKSIIEGSLVCLTYAIKISHSIRAKMLLPGHQTLKTMNSVQTKNCPVYITNDLLGYYVLAERKRVYKNEIEEEVLTLAPEFEPKPSNLTYDEKVEKLVNEGDKSITWTHLLNYQTKLQRISSMKNLNQLSNGKNRFKYSEFYTLAFTPIFNNFNQVSARLFDLNRYLSTNLDIYKTECIAVYPSTDNLKQLARRLTSSFSFTYKDVKSLTENTVKYYDSNKGVLTITSVEKLNVSFLAEKDKLDESQPLVVGGSNLSDESNSVFNQFGNKLNQLVKKISWSYLEQWPSNYNYFFVEDPAIKQQTDFTQLLDFLITFNWYKDLSQNRLFSNDLPTNNHYITVLVGVKDTTPSNNHQIKVKYFVSEKVYTVHDKLATLATIADTVLDSSDQSTTSEVRHEFVNSLKECLRLISDLFNKKLPSSDSNSFDYFDLKASNVVELEQIFNPMFGGQTNDESLKGFLLSLFN